MDLPWGDERSVQFITNVGLVTTVGSAGQNIMACEWTHHVSYRPGMTAVCVGKDAATNKNIRETNEFGVSLAATDQTVLTSIAGGYSGTEKDKIKALQEIGFSFYKGKKIRTLMVEGAAMNAECRLIKTLDIGSHTIFIGEVLEASASGKEPLAYHKGKYWKMTTNIEKPPSEEKKRMDLIVEKYSKDRG